MIRRRVPMLFAALLVGVVSVGGVLAQAPPAVPPGPASRFSTRFTIADAPEQFDQVLTLVEFQPGSWMPPHTSGGNVYTTVVQGVISTLPLGSSGPDAVYEAGATFVEIAGEYTAIGNTGDVSARTMSTTVLPKGAPLTIYVDNNIEAYRNIVDGYRIPDMLRAPARPTTVQHVTADVERPAGAFELVHLLVEFEPGVWTARQMHGGHELAMVATGAVTLERRGEVEVFALGDSWVNTPGSIHKAGNQSEHLAQVAASFLLPIGAVLTTVQPAEAPAAANP